MGRATQMAMNVVKRVPVTSGIMQKCFWEKRGVHSLSVRNSDILTSLKKE
jgi:hypothetical protein